jgi:thioredoxin 1
MVIATSANFDTEVINSKIPVIVVFGAAWNSQSNLISRQLDRLDQETIKNVRVDIDNSPDLGLRFSIRFCPYLMVFRDGIAVYTNTMLTDDVLKAAHGMEVAPNEMG